jgi:hypothetical protein
VGDVDGDGAEDVAIGACQLFKTASAPTFAERLRGTSPGYVVLLSGRDGSVLRRVDGAPEDRQFGVSIAAIGDLDCDGLRDLVIGAPGGFGGSTSRLCVYSLGRGAPLHVLSAPQEAKLGDEVMGAGDVNHDGYPDYLARQDVDEDLCCIVRSGADGSRIELPFDDPALVWCRPVQPLDAEGDAEVLTTDMPSNGMDWGTDRARVKLMSLTTGSVIRSFEEPIDTRDLEEPRKMLVAFAAVNLDGDGHPDVVLNTKVFLAGVNRLTVFRGSDGAALLHAVGTDSCGFTGAVSAPGDLDGDGRGDLVLGMSLPDAEDCVVALRIEQPAR